MLKFKNKKMRMHYRCIQGNFVKAFLAAFKITFQFRKKNSVWTGLWFVNKN